MAKYDINVGNSANDGRGDPLRVAMEKVNYNFQEIYDTISPDPLADTIRVANTIHLGNSSVNGMITATNYTGTSQNSLYLGGIASGYYVTNNQSRILSGNLNFSAANVYFDRGLFVNTVVVANSSGVFSNALVNSVSGNFGTLNVANDVNVTGNLTVSGDVLIAGQTTFVNATIITTKNKNMIVANGSVSAAAANGAGYIIASYANLVYNNVQDSLQSNVNITAASNNLTIGSATNVWNIYGNNVNAAVYTVGSSFIANTSRTTINLLDVTGNTTTNNLFVNNYALIGANVGFDFTTGSFIGLAVKESQNAFVQAIIQNANNGVNSTGDLVIATDTGNDTVNFVNFGIGSSTYANSLYSIHGPKDAYIFSSNSNIVIGTASANSIIFHTGGTLISQEAMRITGIGNVGIGNTSPGTLFVLSNNPNLGSADGGFVDLEFITQIASQDGVKNQVVLDSNTGSYVAGRVHGGGSVTPNNTPAETTLIALNTRGYGNTDWIDSTTAEIALVSQETFTDTAGGSYFKVFTTPTGTIGKVEQMRIMAGGNTGLGNSAPIDRLRIEGTHSVLTSITVANASQNAFVSNTTGVYHVGFANAFTHTANNGSNTWWANSTTVYLANTSANITVVPNGITIANSVAYVTMGNSTVNSTVNTAALSVTNSTGIVTSTAYGLNVSANDSSYISVGNTTVNTYSNNSTYYIANSTGTVTTTAYGLTISANVNSYLIVGNSSVNSVINATGITTTGNVSSSGFVYGSNGVYTINTYAGTYTGGIVVDYTNTMGRISVGQSDGLTIYSNGVGNVVMFTTNTAGIFVNGAVNAASYNIGTSFIANSTAIVGTGYANVTTSVNSALLTVGTSFIANTTGAYHTGTMNAASYTVGTNVVINATSVYTNNDLILTNNKTLRFTTLSGSANVGFRHQNDDNFVFYSTDTTGTQRAVWSIFANSSTSNLGISVPTQIGDNLTVTTNTFTLGTSTKAANGYTYLPNGLKMNWGWVSANATTGDITFSSAFSTACYTVTATAVNSASANTPSVTAISTTGASIRSLSTAAASNVYFIAIGQ